MISFAENLKTLLFWLEEVKIAIKLLIFAKFSKSQENVSRVEK